MEIINWYRTRIDDQFWIKFSGMLIKYLASVSRVKIGAGSEEKSGGKYSPPRSRLEYHIQVWVDRYSRALYYFYFYFSIKLIVYCVLAYPYDYHVCLLKSFRMRTKTGGNESFDKTLSELEEMVKIEKVQLKMLGAPYVDFNFVAVGTYQFLFWINVFCYLETQLFYRYCETFVCDLMNVILDQKTSQLDTKKLIREELDNYLDHQYQASRTSLLTRLPSSGSKLMNLAQDSKLVGRQLRHMMMIGSLNPFNRSRQWIHYMSKLFSSITIVFLLNNHLVVIIIIFVLLPAHDEHVIETEPRDILVIAETGLYAALSIVSSCFYIAMINVSNCDQVHEILEITKRMRKCAMENELIFDRLRREDLRAIARAKRNYSERTYIPNQTRRYNHLVEMNTNLAYVYMHYRIFVRQRKAQNRTISSFIIVVFQSCLLSTFITRTHAPLTGDRLSSQVAMCVCAISFFNGYLCLIPLCYMGARCRDMYAAIFSLCAHITRIQQLAPNNSPYDKRLVDSVFREIEYPDYLLSQFATRTLGVLINYENFFKMLFWFGILQLSTFFAVENGSPIGTTSFGDSLRLF